MRRIVALVLISLLFGRFWAPPAAATVLQPTPAAQAPSSDKYADKIRAFEEFVRQQMEFDRTPGLTIGFMKDDYVWVKGFGYADLENRAPAKAESAYRLASVMPHARPHLINEAGHFVWLDQPAAFEAALRSFLVPA